MNSQARGMLQGGGAQVRMFQKGTPSDGTEKKKKLASSGQGLFSPEAAICLGV